MSHYYWSARRDCSYAHFSSLSLSIACITLVVLLLEPNFRWVYFLEGTENYTADKIILIKLAEYIIRRCFFFGVGLVKSVRSSNGGGAECSNCGGGECGLCVVGWWASHWTFAGARQNFDQRKLNKGRRVKYIRICLYAKNLQTVLSSVRPTSFVDWSPSNASNDMTDTTRSSNTSKVGIRRVPLMPLASCNSHMVIDLSFTRFLRQKMTNI